MCVNLGCDRVFSMIVKLQTWRRFVCSSSGGYDCVHQGPGSIKQTSLLTMVILHLAAHDTSDTSYLLFMTSGHNRQHGWMQRRWHQNYISIPFILPSWCFIEYRCIVHENVVRLFVFISCWDYLYRKDRGQIGRSVSFYCEFHIPKMLSNYFREI